MRWMIDAQLDDFPCLCHHAAGVTRINNINLFHWFVYVNNICSAPNHIRQWAIFLFRVTFFFLFIWFVGFLRRLRRWFIRSRFWILRFFVFLNRLFSLDKGRFFGRLLNSQFINILLYFGCKQLFIKFQERLTEPFLFGGTVNGFFCLLKNGFVSFRTVYGNLSSTVAVKYCEQTIIFACLSDVSVLLFVEIVKLRK